MASKEIDQDGSNKGFDGPSKAHQYILTQDSLPQKMKFEDYEIPYAYPFEGHDKAVEQASLGFYAKKAYNHALKK